MSIKFPHVVVKLTKADATIQDICVKVARAMRHAGVSNVDIDEYQRTAKPDNVDYRNFYQVTDSTVTII